MKVGIMADSHDNLAAIKYLVNYFNQKNVDLLLHAGDFISPFTIPALAEFDGRVLGVFGNNDGDRETLQEMAEKNEVELFEAPREIEVGNKEFLIAHRPQDLPEEISEEIDLVVSGHTHEPAVEDNSTLHLNPGEAGGWLTGVTSGLIFDTETDNHCWVRVPAP